MELDTIHNTDALTYLRTLPDESVNCCVTSPPYFGLRSYLEDDAREIGKEPTPKEYIAAMVTVFRELRRVLRSDGVVWLNIGDSYAGSGKGGQSSEKRSANWQPEYSNHGARYGFKAKDRMMIPARLAIALQDDGWWLRDEIVWHKNNPMPSPVDDRTTTAHEMVYLLTKSPRYWYDAEAVAEPAVSTGGGDFMPALKVIQPEHGGESRTGKWARNSRPQESTRNRRSVWTINPEPLAAAHFAVMPSKLVEICVLAGCPPKVCSACGAPYQRVVERTGEWRAQHKRTLKHNGEVYRTNPGGGVAGPSTSRVTIDRGFTPTCNCHAPHDSGIVIDPFMGAGTVALVAQRLNRHFIGSDLNPEYVRMATMRVQGRLDEYLAEQRGEPHTAYMFTEGAQP